MKYFARIAILLASVAMMTRVQAEQPAAEVLPPVPDPAVKPEPHEIPKPLDAPGPEKKSTLDVDENGFKATIIHPEPTLPTIDFKSIKSGEKQPVDEVGAGKTAEGDPITPLLVRAIARERSGLKPKDAVQLYTEVLNREPDNIEAGYRLGLAFARAGEMQKGLNEVEKAIEKRPRNAKYRCDYGLLALKAGWIEKAYKACQSAAGDVPKNARYQSALGDVNLAMGKVQEAGQFYARAIALDPTNADYIHNFGIANMYAGGYRQAAEVFAEAIRLKPNNSSYYCSEGTAQESLKNGKDAMTAYRMAIKLDKDNAEAHYRLAALRSDPDDPTYTDKFEAVEHAEIAVKLTRFQNARYLMGLARALRIAYNYDQAIAAAQKAIAIDPRPEYREELSHFEQLKKQGYVK